MSPHKSSSTTTSLKPVSIFISSTSSVNFLILFDRRNKLATTLGATNVNDTTISVKFPSLVPELFFGMNSTEPMFFIPDVLCHSMRWGGWMNVSRAVQLLILLREMQYVSSLCFSGQIEELNT